MQVILTNIRCILKIKLQSVYVEISELPLFFNKDLPIGGTTELQDVATSCILETGGVST